MAAPDPLDALGTAWFLVVFVAGPVAGWLWMVADIRAYLRRLKRAMVLVGAYATTPYWALRERPDCLLALGLERGCSADEVMAAYRLRVKTAHPDHGGSRDEFERLQRYLGEALRLAAGDDQPR
ncbi:J domain-containing protein [Botrimarina sp.]|uniref:J domain-containing protein n=1 Tax=Botrimarina sp. TaxID=2795802 RepID=UPI0032EE3D76